MRSIRERKTDTLRIVGGIWRLKEIADGEIIMLISERIYEFLKEKNISQIEFAQKTGISQSTVSDWRRKGTNPSADKIMVICEVLEISPYELLLGAESKNKKRLREENYIVLDKSSVEYQIIETFHSLNEETQKRLMSYMRMLKREK